MQVLIIIISILAVLYFIGKYSEPDVEDFDLNQLKRHVKNLQKWIDANSNNANISEHEKAVLSKKQAQLERALLVWQRKNEQAIANENLQNINAIATELAL